MSGDWIKMRVSLLTHPKVIRIGSALKADRLRAVGAIFAVWSVFDQHSEDGRLDGYSAAAMDEAVGCRGITAAMEAVHWLEVDEDGITAVEFDEHNSKSAKRRALDTGRKKSARDADKTANGSWNSDGQMSASDADKPPDKVGTREELEKKNSSSSKRGGALTVPDLVAEGVTSGHAEDWLRVRKQHKAPLTPTAWEGLKREASKAGMTPGEAVRIAAERSWRSFNAEWLEKPRNGADPFAGAH
jgi:hypothetical protein